MPCKVASEALVWIGGLRIEGQRMRGMKRVVHGRRSFEAMLVEKELAKGAAIEWLHDHYFTGVAFDCVADIWFDGYQHVVVAEMLLTFMLHLASILAS